MGDIGEILLEREESFRARLRSRPFESLEEIWCAPGEVHLGETVEGD